MKANVVSMLAVGAILAPASFAQDPGEVQKLRDEIASLQDRLASIEGRDWLTEQRSEQIKSLIHDVIADADTRSSLLQSGMTAGYDKGFFIGSSDGNFSLRMNGQVQTRWVYNMQDESPEDDNRSGFEMRRVKLKFKGHAWDPSWTYAINGAFDRGDGTYGLEEAQIKKTFDNGTYLRVGQFKGPFLREELVSSSKTQAVERSLVNEEFNQDRSQGIEWGYESDTWRVMAMYSDGFSTRNSPALDYDTELALMGRAEFLLSGNWKQFGDTISWDGDEQGVLIGAAAAYDKDESGTAGVSKEEIFRWTIDASLEFGGANVFACFTGRHIENGTDLDQYGAVIQGGFFLTPNEWEAFARYEWGDADDGSEDLSVITLGVNRYWNKHGLKWTTDIGFALDEVTSTWAASGAGWRADAAGEDGQIVIRSQLQLLF